MHISSLVLLRSKRGDVERGELQTKEEEVCALPDGAGISIWGDSGAFDERSQHWRMRREASQEKEVELLPHLDQPGDAVLGMKAWVLCRLLRSTRPHPWSCGEHAETLRLVAAALELSSAKLLRKDVDDGGGSRSVQVGGTKFARPLVLMLAASLVWLHGLCAGLSFLSSGFSYDII